MRWWKKFRSWDNKGLLIDRVEGDIAYTKKGYVFDRRIFTGYLIIVFITIIYIMITSNVGHKELYLHCTHITPCSNPFYNNCDQEVCQGIKDQEFLPSGFELGTPPSLDFMRKIKGLLLIIFSGIVIALLINHRVHNKGRPLDTIMNMGEEV